MNRYRLQQILEVLLFPVTDPDFGTDDVLLSYYQAYWPLAHTDGKSAVGAGAKDRAVSEYHRRRRALTAYLVSKSHGKIKSEDDVMMLCQLYYPMEEIRQEMEAVQRARRAKGYAVIERESICRYYLRKLSDISASLITYRDGTAAIRQWVDNDNTVKTDIFRSGSVYNKVEIWNLLCRITVPDLYIVMAAVDNRLGMEALYEQKSYITLADKLLHKVLQKGLAENHMHFHAGMDYEAIWLRCMDLGFLEECSFKTRKPETYQRLGIALFRVLAACYVEEGGHPEGFDEWLNQPERSACMRELVYAMTKGNVVQETAPEDIRDILFFYQELASGEAVRSEDYLLVKVYDKYLEYKISSEFILLYQCYRYVAEHVEDSFFACAFLQYIRFKNAYFRQLLEGNELQGLGYFRGKYRRMRNSAATVMRESDAMLESFRFQAKIGCLKKLEIRVAPNVKESDVSGLNAKQAQKILMIKLYDQIYGILYAYRRYILECLIGVRETWALMRKEEVKRFIGKDIEQVISECKDKRTLSVPSPGIIFHFIKSEMLEKTSDTSCWRYAGKKEEDVPVCMGKRYFIINIAIAIERMRSTVPGLDEYLVGIDAASEENAMEPWMFAQAYRLMRSRFYTKPVLQIPNGTEPFRRVQNIGFTYHVGEDFRHIVSGFRHIDEVLEEFTYKAGDRLGHVLALGIDVAQWVTDNEVVPIPVLERLENLLWMWGVNTCDGLNLPVRLEMLENIIMDIAQEIYSDPETITVKMLYQAYKHKLQSDHAAIVAKVHQEDGGRYPDCERCEINDNYREDGVREHKGWNSEKLLLTNYCSYYQKKYAKVQLVSVSKSEIAVYQKLQTYLVQKIEKKGIYLEANPTSNLAIGDFSHIGDHPIFKLDDIRVHDGNHSMITVNSDNPTIFNTNAENELDYIYYAADEFGYSKSEILEWIDRIRQRGMDASFIKNEKDGLQILSEIQEIMDWIKKKNF